MIKSELIKAIQDASDEKLTKIAVMAVLDTLPAVISTTLRGGNEVKFPGLGIFKPVDRPARVGRNPFTGESIDIKAKTSMKFKPSLHIVKSLNE